MTDQPAPPAPRRQPDRPRRPALRSALVDLAGASRDTPRIAELLDLIVELVMERVEPVAHAAIVLGSTASTGSATSTGSGGGDSGDGGGDGWSGYGPALHLPLFAGSGEMVAMLVLRGPDPIEMMSLGWRLRSLYESASGPDRPTERGHHLGTDELVSGMAEALAVRDRIQLALGVLMELRQCSPPQAYLALLEEANTARQSLVDMASAVVESVSGRGSSPLPP